MSFQQVFEHLSELKSNPLLALDAGSSHVRGGEQHMGEQLRKQQTVQWEPISDFALQDEDSDKEVAE